MSLISYGLLLSLSFYNSLLYNGERDLKKDVMKNVNKIIMMIDRMAMLIILMLLGWT